MTLLESVLFKCCKRFLLFLFFALSTICDLVGQQLNTRIDSSAISALPFIRHASCRAPMMGPYVPTDLTSVTQLPDSIRKKLETYLISRLGQRFYKSMEFYSGQKVDLQKLYLIHPAAHDYKWTVASYYLCFTCKSLPDVDSYYTAGVQMDIAGRVIEPINLPSIAHDSTKGRIINWRQATKIARRNGVRTKNCTLSYSPPLDVLVWGFRKSREPRPGLILEKRIFIDANSGQILRKRNDRRRYISF